MSTYETADLLLRNGTIIDPFRGTIEQRDVAIKEGRFFSFQAMPAAQVIDVSGLYLAPGLIDSHLHLEGLHLLPAAYARAFLAHGTTAIVTDLHEIANAGGLEGLLWYLELLENLPLDIFIMAPSSVPSCPFEKGAGVIGVKELNRLRKLNRVIGLGEVMNIPGVQKRDREVMEKVRLFSGRPIDGHAPGLKGRDLVRYLSAGICSDHETAELGEGEEKLRHGTHLFLRMGSASQDLKRLIPLIGPHTIPLLSLCTDDLSTADLARFGHMDGILRYLMEKGVSLLDALRLATTNPADYFGLVDRNRTGIGKKADLVLFDGPKAMKVRMVVKNGGIVYREGDPLWPEVPTASATNGGTRIADFEPAELQPRARGKKIHVIALQKGELATRHVVEDARVENGLLTVNDNRELSLAYAFDRYRRDRRFGFGFVKGLSIHGGAIGTTYTHDSHNVVIAGDNVADIYTVLAHLRQGIGGMATSRGGRIEAFIPMPYYGILTDLPGDRFLKREAEMKQSMAKMGVKTQNIFFQLSFLSLPVIPALRLTTRGLFDVAATRYIRVNE